MVSDCYCGRGAPVLIRAGTVAFAPLGLTVSLTVTKLKLNLASRAAISPSR